MPYVPAGQENCGRRPDPMTTCQPVLHWFDFICPFCYVAQDRNRILRDAGVEIAELPMQIHPEIGPGGAPAPRRTGAVYTWLATEARAAGLVLNWSARIPYSRPALAAAETVRVNQPGRHRAFIAAVFDAYFGHGQDIGDGAVIAECAAASGVDPLLVGSVTTPAVADDALRCPEAWVRAHEVTGTPSWLVGEALVVGLQPREYFVRLGDAVRGDRREQAGVGQEAVA